MDELSPTRAEATSYRDPTHLKIRRPHPTRCPLDVTSTVEKATERHIEWAGVRAMGT
ncbi:hypothetical protein NY08_3719 [Rhodococcus sp. B7740]|nr:hypothetical protein NY08_3719 [Rhodococcus sp. B7740]